MVMVIDREFLKGLAYEQATSRSFEEWKNEIKVDFVDNKEQWKTNQLLISKNGKETIEKKLKDYETMFCKGTYLYEVEKTLCLLCVGNFVGEPIKHSSLKEMMPLKLEEVKDSLFYMAPATIYNSVGCLEVAKRVSVRTTARHGNLITLNESVAKAQKRRRDRIEKYTPIYTRRIYRTALKNGHIINDSKSKA